MHKTLSQLKANRRWRARHKFQSRKSTYGSLARLYGRKYANRIDLTKMIDYYHKCLLNKKV